MTSRIPSPQRIGVTAFAAQLALAVLLAACSPPSANGPALHRAVLNDDIAAARKILESDPASVRATDPDGMTALHFAAARLRLAPNAVEVQEPRDRSGAQPSQGCGATPALTSYDIADMRSGRISPRALAERLATKSAFGPMAELLVEHGAPLNAKEKGRGGLTPLQLAVTMGHMDVAQVLLAHGADIAATDDLGLTALHMVAQSGNLAMVRLLLDKGAAVDATAGGFLLLPVFKDDTPLGLATICNHREVVDLLLQRGANPNRKVHDGFAPLHLAERADIAALLLAHGASLELRGYEDRTPLDQAAMQGRQDVAEFLLSRGASIEARDDKGRTPLLLAIGPTTNAPDMVAFLIRKGAKVNVRDKDGRTPLLAALSHDGAVVKLLLDGGADVNAPDQYGRTALHWAVEDNNIALVRLLLAYRANVNVEDSTRHTPLYYTWGGSAADKEIAALLRQHGAH